MKQAYLILLLSILSIATYSQSKISVADASQHIGDSVKIIDKVLKIKRVDGGITLLNLGNTHDNQPLAIVITTEVNKDFLSKPDDLNLDKIIQVVGKITEYNGNLQIVIVNPTQIKDVTPLLHSPRVKF